MAEAGLAAIGNSAHSPRHALYRIGPGAAARVKKVMGEAKVASDTTFLAILEGIEEAWQRERFKVERVEYDAGGPVTGFFLPPGSTGIPVNTFVREDG